MSRSIRIAVGACLIMALCAPLVLAQPPIPPNVRITAVPQVNNEEQVVICPTDTAFIMANWRDFRLGYRQIGLGRSTDGGQTWVDSLINPLNQINGFAAQQSDPTMDVDKNGNFFMTALDYIPANQYGTSRIAIYRSGDKGLTWQGPIPHHAVTPSTFEDKQFTAIDKSGGPFDGSMYIVWARFPNPTRIMCVRVANDLTSVSDTVIAGPTQGSSACGSGYDAGQFAVPCVDKNGTLHVLWQGNSLDSGLSCAGFGSIKHAMSTDGGATFSLPTPVTPVSGYTVTVGGLQTYSQPATTSDLTAGPHSGNLYICYTNREFDRETGWLEDFSDIDFIRSTDGGTTWSTPMQINDDVNSDLNSSFHPWIVCNEEGILTAIFYDERYDPNHYNFDLIAAYSYDGGATWTSNHRISSVSSNPDFAVPTLAPPSAPLPLDGRFPAAVPMSVAEPMAGRLGEYIGLAVVYDKVNAVWTDTRHGQQEAYSATWQLPLTVPRLRFPDHQAHVPPNKCLKWSTSWKEYDDHYEVQVATDPGFALVVTNQEVDTSAVKLDISLPDGLYYWRVRCKRLSDGVYSDWSEGREVTIDGIPPSVPLLTAPGFNEVVDTNLPLLSWTYTGGASEAATTWVYWSTEPSLTTPELLKTSGPLPDWSTNPPPPFRISEPIPDGVLIYWKVFRLDLAGNASQSTVSQFMFTPSCCKNLVGNADGDPGDAVDLEDLQVYIDYLFFGGLYPMCEDEFDANLDGGIDIADLQAIIDYLFFGAVLPACP